MHVALVMDGSVDLYWIPLGAGARAVRASGKVSERLAALGQRRRPCDLYHSATPTRHRARPPVVSGVA